LPLHNIAGDTLDALADGIAVIEKAGGEIIGQPFRYGSGWGVVTKPKPKPKKPKMETRAPRPKGETRTKR
jgi:hypothetical protein